MVNPSIKDVAARAGVAFQTVGKVLNGKGTVAPETRQRILSAAAELNYVPNRLARGLRSASTLTVGVLAVEFSNPAPTSYLVGIEREARRHGMAAIITSASSDAEDAGRCLRTLTETRVDGLVVIAPTLEADDHFAGLLENGPPVVTLHGVSSPVPSRITSSAGSATLPVGRLVELGHRRIAMIGGVPGGPISEARTQSYRQVVLHHGLGSDPELEDHGEWSLTGGREAMHRILDRCPDATAVYAQNDLMAIGALRALHERGLRVPVDFSVVGCDDDPVSAHLTPSLSTVRIPFVEIGEHAVRTVVRHIAEPDRAPDTVVLPVELIERESTAPPRR